MPKLLSPVKELKVVKPYGSHHKKTMYKETMDQDNQGTSIIPFGNQGMHIISIGKLSEEKKKLVKEKAASLKTKLESIPKQRKSVVFPYNPVF